MKNLSFVFLAWIIIFVFSCKTHKKAVMTSHPQKNVLVGDTITISKNENPSTGFIWKWNILEGKNLFEFLGENFVSSVPDSLLKKGFVGAGGTKTFQFKAKKKGIVVFEFTLSRGEKDIAEKDTLTFEIKAKE